MMPPVEANKYSGSIEVMEEVWCNAPQYCDPILLDTYWIKLVHKETSWYYPD